MRYYLSADAALKLLENPSVYHLKQDELYGLDDQAFEFLKKCSGPDGCDDSAADSKFIEYCLSEGALTTEHISVKRPLLLQAPSPSLRYLELQITDKCNLKCKHCYIGDSPNRELSIRDTKSILDEFEAMQGLRLLITGGEPLMHGRFNEFNSLLPHYNFRKILFTNGLLLDKTRLEALNVDEIQFSVDGMEHGHDALRGKGTYRLVRQKMAEALNAGITVSAATMVHTENLGEFENMDALFRGMGLKDWTVDVPCPAGRLKDNPLFQTPPEIAGKYLDYGFGGGLHGGGEGFACGLHLLSVLADGNICKCAFYSGSPVGNINEGLRKAWGKTRHIKLEELECSALSCKHLDTCRGGCRYRAETTGSALGRDLYKCRSFDILEKKKGGACNDY